MSLRVVHAVESMKPEAGSFAICLPGLQRALRAQGVNIETCLPDGLEHGDAKNAIGRADVVHLLGWGSKFARNVAAVSRKVSVPYVISPLGGMENETNGRSGLGDRLRRNVIDNRLVRNAAAVTAMNEAEEHDLTQDAINKRISLLPLGLDMAEYELDNASAPCSQRMILILARVHPDEGYVPFLKAFSELGEDAIGWTVVIAGRPIEDWRKQLEAAVSRKGGADRIRFADAPDEASQKQWLAKASILVAPSLHMRCGVSVMQAVAAGVPAMATRCVTPTTQDDIVRVCAPTRGDMKLALRALLKLSDDQRGVLAERARKEARKLFDWSVLAERYASLYSNVAKRVAS